MPKQFRKPSPTSRDIGAARVTMSGSRTSPRSAIDCSTSERFAEDAHKDERWEGGAIGADPTGRGSHFSGYGGPATEAKLTQRPNQGSLPGGLMSGEAPELALGELTGGYMRTLPWVGAIAASSRRPVTVVEMLGRR